MQSLDPLPMHGRDLGVNPDDLVETPELEQEAKQEILENKDVSTSSKQLQFWFEWFALVKSSLCVSSWVVRHHIYLQW